MRNILASGETDEVRKLVPIHMENEEYYKRFHAAA
jgi:hypothetical protein